MFLWLGRKMSVFCDVTLCSDTMDKCAVVSFLLYKLFCFLVSNSIYQSLIF